MFTSSVIINTIIGDAIVFFFVCAWERVCVYVCVRVCACVRACVRARGERDGERDRDREREREGERENSETLFYKDCSLGSVKNLSNN